MITYWPTKTPFGFKHSTELKTYAPCLKMSRVMKVSTARVAILSMANMGTVYEKFQEVEDTNICRVNWKCYVIIVIRTDFSVFVAMLHSGLCEQWRLTNLFFARALVYCDTHRCLNPFDQSYSLLHSQCINENWIWLTVEFTLNRLRLHKKFTVGHFEYCCWYIQENAFENVVCKMAVILSRPQCAKGILIALVGHIYTWTIRRTNQSAELMYTLGNWAAMSRVLYTRN